MELKPSKLQTETEQTHGAPGNTANNNERIRSCSAVSPLYFLEHLHSAARERETNWKQERAREEAVYNYTPAWKTKISNLQGAAEQAGQEIARREGGVGGWRGACNLQRGDFSPLRKRLFYMLIRPLLRCTQSPWECNVFVCACQHFSSKSSSAQFQSSVSNVGCLPLVQRESQWNGVFSLIKNESCLYVMTLWHHTWRWCHSDTSPKLASSLINPLRAPCT